MDGFFIYIKASATITATLQRKHIIRWINGLWWQIICNRQHSSATPPWQMWQMGFSASATGTHWFSCVWASVADVYVILYDNSLSCHPSLRSGWQDKDTVFTCLDEHPNASREILQRAKAHSRIRQGVFIKTSRTFSKSSSSFWKSPVKCFTNFSLKNKQLFLVYIINLIIFANKKARRNASKTKLLAF